MQFSPLWRGQGPSFEQNWIPFTQRWFVPSLVEIDPVVLEKKSKIGKVYRRTDRQTDGQTDRQTTNERRSEKLTWAFSSGELKKLYSEWYMKLISTSSAIFICHVSLIDFLKYAIYIYIVKRYSKTYIKPFLSFGHKISLLKESCGLLKMSCGAIVFENEPREVLFSLWLKLSEYERRNVYLDIARWSVQTMTKKQSSDMSYRKMTVLKEGSIRNFVML